jgi:predicted Holliday junction resolvase-like endonuclease
LFIRHDHRLSRFGRRTGALLFVFLLLVFLALLVFALFATRTRFGRLSVNTMTTKRKLEIKRENLENNKFIKHAQLRRNETQKEKKEAPMEKKMKKIEKKNREKK